MMLPRTVDVAVIGAGPAGSVAAALLARDGFEVALLDRDTFPRDKLCGEFLSYDALPILEELGVAGEIDARGATRIDRCSVVAPRTTYTFDLPSSARGISRLALDDILFRHALARGAHDGSGTAADLVRNEDAGFEITLHDREGDESAIRARLVIGAWGRWGRIDQQLGRAFTRERHERHFGFKRHYRRDPSPHGTIELYSFDGGYLGASEVENHVTNICGLVHQSRIGAMRGGWAKFLESVAAKRRNVASLLRDSTPAQEEFLSSDPVIFRAKSAVEGGMLLAGDAAGLIDPLAGNGMAMAVQSAALAAVHARAILRGTTSALQAYAERYERLFANRIAWSRRTALLLSRPRLLHTLLTCRPPVAIGAFLLRRTRAEETEIARLLREVRNSH